MVMYVEVLNDTERIEQVISFSCWSLLWIILTVIPPGSSDVYTSYRLNFVHGILCCFFATLGLFRFIPPHYATMSTISYFIVDFVNIMINDFIFKTKGTLIINAYILILIYTYIKHTGYKKPAARRLEYFHHIFCCSVAITSEIYHTRFCTFDLNPFLQLMFAEFSTPFLSAWRMHEKSQMGPLLAKLFVLAFIACRIVYHRYIIHSNLIYIK